jgi:tetratricopeptide (TPR) repeat protein
MMPPDDPFHAYLTLAKELFEGRISESDLPSAAGKLPPPDKNLLDRISGRAESFSTTKPRFGWALTRVARDAAHARDSGLFLRSLSDWYLARACNHWTQPKRVDAAIAEARRGFEELNDEGWIAACEWQSNAQAWTKPDFAEAARGLDEALKHLHADFVPDCRLALAFAQILIGEHRAALDNIRLSEEAYQARGDALNRARCRLTQASSLRRQDRFDEALQELDQALSIFEEHHALTDQGRARYQIALGHLLRADDLSKAESQFKKAAELFEAADLDLWRGACVNNLGSVYLIEGRLILAEEHYREARSSFAGHGILGALADNLNDSGRLNILMGKPASAVEQFKECEAINERLGSQLSAAIAVSNLGEAYGHLGRYQDALFHLERAVERLEPLGSYFRLATCEKYMALIWRRLGRPQLAHEYLDRSAAHYEMAGQKALLSSVHNYRADALFQQGKETEALKSLEESLAAADRYGLRPQSALARRLLGEALIQSGRREEALEYLQKARSDFAEMEMSGEEAACLLALGTYYRSASDPDRAGSFFEEALKQSEGTFPEVDWRARVELGNLAEARGGIEEAIRMYRLGMETFKPIRGNFLQPALAGSYLLAPSRLFDRIVSVSARAGAAQDALRFIEETKASTLIQGLSTGMAFGSGAHSQELADLQAEIDLLKNRLQATLEEMPALRFALQSRQAREQLKQKIEQYDASKARLERKRISDGSRMTPASFDLDHFRRQANASLGEGWAALDYHMAETELNLAAVTPRDCEVHSRQMTTRFRMALDACDRARRMGEPPLQNDLEILGRFLLPASLSEISPDTHLLIAPHRGLHQVPWPALQPDFAAHALVDECIPCVVPSLHSLVTLWERASSRRGMDRRNGLLVGLSRFNGSHGDLPEVRAEVAALASRLGPEGKALSEEDASWQKLMELKGRDAAGLARFAWLHIATHFTPDRHTGRLGGIALRDGDIWLDQLRDLSPLPGLVSLSACNSNDSFLHEGDERVDLQTTCFIAGANTVIGSAWPVLDEAAAKLMAAFYDHYLAGLSPAKAAAHTQRQWIREGRGLRGWAGFICAGAP